MLTAPNGAPILRIDGPFGTASSDIFRYETVVLVGAGIGVTPFASILKSIRCRIAAAHIDPAVSSLSSSSSSSSSSSHAQLLAHRRTAITKVYFFQIAREPTSFEWFFEVLLALEEDNAGDFLEIHTYLTSAKSAADARRLMATASAPSASSAVSDADAQVAADAEATGRDVLTGLRTPTRYGRPDFKEALGRIAELHPAERVGVFYCGPRALSKQLYGVSAALSRSTATHFDYHKENF